MAMRYRTLWAGQDGFEPLAPLPAWAMKRVRGERKPAPVAAPVSGKPKRQPRNAGNQGMMAKHGTGPIGAKCGGCAHLTRQRHNAGEYFKCAHHGDTRGPGTDHRLYWPACGRFEARPKTMIPPTPVRRALKVACPQCGAAVTLRAWYPNDRNVTEHALPGEGAYGLHAITHGVAVSIGPDGDVWKVERAW